MTPIEISDETQSIPANQEIEQAFLSIVLGHNSAIEFVEGFLRPAHFYNPLHGRLYEAIMHFYSRQQLADILTLERYFKDDAALNEAGGQEYLRTLTQFHLPSTHAEDYARQIYELALCRHLIDLGHRLSANAQKIQIHGPGPIEQIESIERELFDLATQGQDRSFVAFDQALSDAVQSIDRAYTNSSHVVGVATGLIDLDKQLGGLHPSDLIVVAARPGMGKTSFATNIAYAAAQSALKSQGKEGATVAFFSLEMSAEQLAMRLLAQESGVPSDRMRRGSITQENFNRFVEVSRTMVTLPLFIDDTAALTIGGLRTRARRLKRQHSLGLIVVDYIQLLSASNTRNDNRVQEISEITRGLKTLAKELNVPVIALSQLSRSVEQRENKRPRLPDLRESGSIEQDADVVMFLYREEYYKMGEKPDEGSEQMSAWVEGMSAVYHKAEVIIAKQRHGPTGSIYVHFDGKLTKFSNLQDHTTS